MREEIWTSGAGDAASGHGLPDLWDIFQEIRFTHATMHQVRRTRT